MKGPYGDRILVKEFQEETPTGLPETTGHPERVVVVESNIDKIKAGDNIIIYKYGSDEIEINGEKHYLVKEENILYKF